MKPDSLSAALDELRAAWRALCHDVLSVFPAQWRPALKETPRYTWGVIQFFAWCNLIGMALGAIIMLALAFA